MSSLLQLIPWQIGGAEIIGFAVVVFVFLALVNDIRERARISRILEQHWHDIDPRPASGRHHHPLRVVRFDEPSLK